MFTQLVDKKKKGSNSLREATVIPKVDLEAKKKVKTVRFME